VSIWLVALATLAVAAVATIALFRWLYVKVPSNMAFIRTGLGGRRAVLDAGAFVLPIVHNVQWLSLETLKIETLRAKRDGLILKDRYRVDIGAEFYVRIPADPAMIEAASRSLGDKSFSADGISQLVGEKLVSALRSAAARMELAPLHENRRAFALQVRELLEEPLGQNGLVVEDVAIFQLDQTDKAHLDPNNIFDAEGLRQITEQTSARMRERNEIERNTEVAVKRKDVEAVRQRLQLEREQSFAEAEQERQIRDHRVQQSAEGERFRFGEELATREAELGKEQRVRQIELAKEGELEERERERELARIARERALEEAEREKAGAILRAEAERIAREEERLRAEALREQAEQAVRAVAQRAQAEREKEVALIRAAQELELAERRAHTQERLAHGRVKEGEAEARVVELRTEAENLVAEKVIARDVALRLLERMPEILREAMEPARHIDSIRVMDVRGLGGDARADSAADPIRRIYEALLGAGAALPLLRELLDFGERSGVLDKLGESLPELRDRLRTARKASDT
jgi:uncharacterized membrane protein YqiK